MAEAQDIAEWEPLLEKEHSRKLLPGLRRCQAMTDYPVKRLSDWLSLQSPHKYCVFIKCRRAAEKLPVFSPFLAQAIK